MKYYIFAERSAASIFGAAAAYVKGSDGIPIDFETREEAQAYCDKYRAVSNVRYTVESEVRDV